MNYGFFDNSKKEYVVTNPETPLPWINYLGSDEFCGLISANAGGYCFYKDALLRRILRYRYNNVPMDMGGRYLYLRDNDSDDYWSLSWMPVRKPREKCRYECRHGMGYTKITSEYDGIETSTLFFVPKEENNEVWSCEIKNNTGRVRSLSMFSFVEFCLYQAFKDQIDFQYILNVGLTKVEGSVIYNITNYKKDATDSSEYRPDFSPDAVDIFTFFSCSEPIIGYDTQRKDFLGNYGSMQDPAAIKENKCKNSLARGWSPIGAHQIAITLNPGESRTVNFVLGVAKEFGDEAVIIEKYKDCRAIKTEMNKLADYWNHNLSAFNAKTPDEDTDTMLNIWNQYQCRITFNWSRSASFYESGIGRGMGFRDSCQDILGFVHIIPEEARTRLLDIASTQFETGDAYHQYQPLNKKGDGGGYSDDHLWLILAASQFIKESGDLSVLSEIVPYRCGINGQSGTLYEHLEKALDFTDRSRGPHGLPLLFNADWNDALNSSVPLEKGESVFTAMLFVFAAKEMVRIAEINKDAFGMEKYRKYAGEMSDTINKYAWDGKWYKGAYSQKGVPMGSNESDYGKIYLLPQAWAVIAGVGDKDRLTLAMDSLNQRLATEHGIVLHDPAYKTYDSSLGGITVYLPGLKENAAIFCHSNPWAVIAEAILGRGDLAFQYHKAILPTSKNDISDLRKTEPYVYCQMIAGKEHEDFGEGKNSWLTGTAAWSFFSVSSYILGVRADYEGLLIDPAIPPEWEGFSVYRRFRNAEYEIQVVNPCKVSKGIKSIKVNGSKIEGRILPYADKQKYLVEVEMG